MYDPSLGIDYMLGSPAGAGNQIDFTAIQAFDFPTVYSNKKLLSKHQITQGDFQKKVLSQDLLLETKLTCIQVIYLNKLNRQLKQRIADAQKIYTDYNTKLARGEVNIIELNKAKINLLNVQSEFRLNEGEINSFNQKLTFLNGGIQVVITDTIYPPDTPLPMFEELEKQYEAVDPLLKNLEQQTLIVQQQISLTKALRLPKFETGYHYQAILGQTFSGIHFGMSLPLWQNKKEDEKAM